MKGISGSFVTLKKKGALRGCIGEIFPVRPLNRSVFLNALSAAFRDHRFPPLQDEELDEVEIEISVLTRPRPIQTVDEIELGRHGIVLERGNHRAVFLPQVAPEQGWTLEEALAHLSVKAGLDPNGWREGTQFQVFEANVFCESDLSHEGEV
jgi:AmmeMemoRadiSam system protein A